MPSFAQDAKEETEEPVEPKEVDAPVPSIVPKHPFLIVKREMFEELRERATREPWATMKKDAIEFVNKTRPAPSHPVITDLASAAALLYILEPENARLRARRVRDALKQWGDFVPSGYVQGNAFFTSVLALDIVYDDLTQSEQLSLEAKLNEIAEQYFERKPAWVLNALACRTLWALYVGSDQPIQQTKTAYREYLMSVITDEGIYNQGPGYAALRLGGERLASSHMIDVLEFTGHDKYYTDKRMIKFNEWLYGYSTAPNGGCFIFGDTSPASKPLSGPAALRAGRFSKTAAQYATRFTSKSHRGRLLNYLFTADEKIEPAVPASRAFTDGGAWLLEKEQNPESMAGVLWNAKSAGTHSHKDVNSVDLYAYGTHVLRNVGFMTLGRGLYGFNWRYINLDAKSNNTVLIDRKDHTLKYGDGVIDSHMTGVIDFASASSGKAIPNGKHVRNLFFVHPQKKSSGYWVIIDEITSNEPDMPVAILLHPNTDLSKEVSPGLEFTCKIRPIDKEIKDVGLSILLGTPPTRVTQNHGLIANSKRAHTFIGRYLECAYKTDDEGKRRVVSVMFPYDSKHKKADMARLQGEGFTGARIGFGSSNDYVMESDGSTTLTHGKVAFRGKSIIYRQRLRDVTFFFVRHGNAFSDAASFKKFGYTSDRPITIMMHSGKGVVKTKTRCKISFYKQGIRDVLVDGREAQRITKSGSKWTIYIPAGEHQVEVR